jgi:hypothetical protein
MCGLPCGILVVNECKHVPSCKVELSALQVLQQPFIINAFLLVMATHLLIKMSEKVGTFPPVIINLFQLFGGEHGVENDFMASCKIEPIIDYLI